MFIINVNIYTDRMNNICTQVLTNLAWSAASRRLVQHREASGASGRSPLAFCLATVTVGVRRKERDWHSSSLDHGLRKKAANMREKDDARTQLSVGSGNSNHG